MGLILPGISMQPGAAVETVRRAVRHFFQSPGPLIGNRAVHEDNSIGGVVTAPVVAPPPPPAAPPARVCGACHAI